VEQQGQVDYLRPMYDLLGSSMAVRLSYTKLDTYRTCPRKYKFVYLDKKREPPSEAMLVGKAVHSALETWVAVEGKDVGDLLDIFTASVEAQRKEGEITEEEEELARTMLYDYFESISTIDVGLVIGIEEEFEMRLPGLIITGIIDRAEYLDESKEVVVITDYKSGRSSISQKNAPNNMQMAIYTLAGKQIWPAKRHITQLEYPRLSKVIKHEFTDEELAKHVAQIRELAANMRFDTRLKPAGTPPICGNCGYKYMCGGWGLKMDKMWQGIKKKRGIK
jgi:CRISPR/Cas system-associated exonuclease Cas4 (RecB family)